jgi:thiosulfate dehydrogenase [quinone] large subunit
MSTGEIRLESTVAGFTASGKLHTLSVWFILALRLMMGIAFFQSGFSIIRGGASDLKERT